MNKIFKKIWNKRRGCFVAVSEAMTVAGQSSKTSVIVGLAMLLSGMMAANAVTLSGDITVSQLPLGSTGGLKENSTVNGTLTVSKSTGSQFLLVGVTDSTSNKYFPDITLAVNGTLNIASDGWLDVGHNRNSSDLAKGTLIVNGNMNVNGVVNAGIRSEKHKGSIESHITVTDTLTVNAGGTFHNNSDNGFGEARLNGYLNIANIRNSGIFRMLGGQSVIGNFGNLYQEAGVFQQTANNTYHFTGSVRLNGGSLDTADSIVIGQKIGKFSIGDSLILSGGALANRALISQKAGNFVVEKGNYNFETINKENGTLSNAGSLTVTNFNQSNGSSTNSGSLTIGNADLYGSLNNTGTLTLTGNVTSRGNLSGSGTLNNRGNWTETNRFTIAGNLNNTGSVNFRNGFQFAANGRLNSSGTVQTNNALDVFDSLGTTGQQDLHYVSLNSTVPQEVKTSLSDFFQKYVAGTVAQDLINHASFTGGKVIVTGVNLTQTQADDLTKAFKTKFFLS